MARELKVLGQWWKTSTGNYTGIANQHVFEEGKIGQRFVVSCVVIKDETQDAGCSTRKISRCCDERRTILFSISQLQGISV